MAGDDKRNVQGTSCRLRNGRYQFESNQQVEIEKIESKSHGRFLNSNWAWSGWLSGGHCVVCMNVTRNSDFGQLTGATRRSMIWQ